MPALILGPKWTRRKFLHAGHPLREYVAYLPRGGWVMPAKLGVLLSNLGTPAAPTTAAVRAFLSEFLSDPRVIRLPRWLWLPVLHGIVLRTRPARAAAAYRAIWREDGSPLLYHARVQAEALQRSLDAHPAVDATVAIGMRYGSPSIAGAVDALLASGADPIVVLALYPQFSDTTTGSTHAAVRAALKARSGAPEVHLIEHYYQHPAYLSALADSVREHWRVHGRGERLLLSFHGLPKRYCDAGDPYAEQCADTARRLASALDCAESEWAFSFQSRMGRGEWLRPYTDATLGEWGREGIARVQVLCPGFSADCLETLEEIAITAAAQFLAAGGGTLEYIPALNQRPDHVAALAQLVLRAARVDT